MPVDPVVVRRLLRAAVSGTTAPETYADALTALGASGMIPTDMAATLAGAVRLRNLLVHGYLDVDHGRLFDELGWIDETARFAEIVERWLERNVDRS